MKTDLSSPAATAEFSKFAGILSAEYIMGNAGLDEAQAGIARRNINNLRFTDDTTLW